MFINLIFSYPLDTFLSYLPKYFYLEGVLFQCNPNNGGATRFCCQKMKT